MGGEEKETYIDIEVPLPLYQTELVGQLWDLRASVFSAGGNGA